MKIKINTEFIKLGQLIKLADLVSSGAQVKEIISKGMVKINGETIFQRGKKVYKGDAVEVLGEEKITVE